MRIALVAPPYLSVPPKGYGGTEKIVALLADGLVGRGHDVTLFASGDSMSRAKLMSIFPVAIGNSGLAKGDLLLPLLHYHEVLANQNEFDLIHSHAQYVGLFVFDRVEIPVVHTWHGSFYPGEVPESKRQVLSAFPGANIISISNNQRGGMPSLHYVATVYNGLDQGEYPYIQKPKGQYLVWVGRITKKKGPLPAILAAKQLGMPIQLAAAVDPIDQAYFESAILPEIDGTSVLFHGELSHKDLMDLYGNAMATLYPITWHEPFGLVMIESMACGTPVVAYNSGSVPEIIEDEKTGFVVDGAGGIDALARAVKNISSIDRSMCRARVVSHFSSETMIGRYEEVYEKILAERKTSQ